MAKDTAKQFDASSMRRFGSLWFVGNKPIVFYARTQLGEAIWAGSSSSKLCVDAASDLWSSPRLPDTCSSGLSGFVVTEDQTITLTRGNATKWALTDNDMIKALTEEGLDTRRCEGNPVDPLSGMKLQVETDYVGAGPNPMVYRRYYSSQGFSYDDTVENVRKFTLGQSNGWRFIPFPELRQFVLQSGEQAVRVIRPDHESIVFRRQPSGAWATHSAVPYHLESSANGWLLLTGDNTLERYDVNGRIVESTNAQGLATAYGWHEYIWPGFSWPGSSFGPEKWIVPSHIDDGFGHRINFAVIDKQALERHMVDPAGGAVRYNHGMNWVAYPEVVNSDGTKSPHQVGYGYETSQSGGAMYIRREAYQPDVPYPMWYHWHGDSPMVSHQYYVKFEDGGWIKRYPTTFSYDSPTQTTVTDHFGGKRIYTFAEVNGVKRIKSIQGSCATSCTPTLAKVDYVYNTDGSWKETQTDAEGYITEKRYKKNGMIEWLVQAKGTALQRSTYMVYRTLPMEQFLKDKVYITNKDYFDGSSEVLEIKYEYEPGTRRTKSVTTKDIARNISQTVSYEYYPEGSGRKSHLLKSVDGPRTDINDKTTYDYDESGNMPTVTNPLGHTTKVLEVDAHGHPLAVEGPNKNVTKYKWDARGHLREISQQPSGSLLKIDYHPNGEIKKTISVSGKTLNYEYDFLRRIKKVYNIEGSIEYNYTLQPAATGGEMVDIKTKDPSGVIMRDLTQIKNGFDQLIYMSSQDADYRRWAYDARGHSAKKTIGGNYSGNNTSTVLPDIVVQSTYNALGQLDSTLYPGGKKETYGYDIFGNINSITDQRNIKTTYSYDAFGRLREINSPESGKITFTPDANNSKISRRNADGNEIVYGYSDPLGRITSVTFTGDASSTITYKYDETSNRLGHLTSVSDKNSTSFYDYYPDGRLRRETRGIESRNFVTQYNYTVDGDIASVTYPSGRIVHLGYKAAGTLRDVVTQAQASGAQTVLANYISHLPFGPTKEYSLGNGMKVARTFDKNYRLDTQSLDSGDSYDLDYYSTGQIEWINKKLRFKYDDVFRLTEADGGYSCTSGPDGGSQCTEGPYSLYKFGYDVGGNRLSHSRSLPGASESYTVSSSSNRVTGVSGSRVAAYTYDANGNVTDVGLWHYDYNRNGQMVAAKHNGKWLATYTYGPRGLRDSKDTGIKTYYVYDQQGQLIAEADPNGNIRREYVYLEGQPLAVFDYPAIPSNSLYGQAYGENNSDGRADAEAPAIPLATSGQWKITWRSDSMSYTVQKVGSTNQAPIADAGPDQTVYLNNGVATAAFNGNNSRDPDGSIASYSWTSTAWSGSKSGASPSHGFTQAGSYAVTLTVTDAGGLTASDTLQIIVKTPTSTYPTMMLRGTHNAWASTPMALNSQAVWSATVTFGAGVGERFKFDVKGDWTINFGDANGDKIAEQGGADILITQGAGSYTITFNDTTRAYSIQKAAAGNQLPIADAGLDQSVTLNNGSVMVYFNGSNSRDPDGSLAVYRWDSTAWHGGLSGDRPSFTFTQAGIYQVILTVTDNQNATSTDTVQITVNNPGESNWQRTLVFIYGQTVVGQDMFIRGGIDWTYAKNYLGKDCAVDKWLCAIPIKYRNNLNNTTKPWKAGDSMLDWYGKESNQGAGAEGSALDWTTNAWPSSWGSPTPYYDQVGYGQTAFNSWGHHYWLLDVDMDCSKTVNGWFELKSYISNGPGWENNVSQAGAPYSSANHFAQCGKLNKFMRGSAEYEIKAIPSVVPMAAMDAAEVSASMAGPPFSAAYVRVLGGDSSVVTPMTQVAANTWEATVSATAASGNRFYLELPRAAQTGFIYNNYLGAPVKITDAAKNVLWKADYLPFGALASTPSGSLPFNVRFPGQYYDAETGLHYNGARFYDPQGGRYLQPDPLGQAAGLNIYPYAYNNPVNYVDPDGKFAFMIPLVVGAYELIDLAMSAAEAVDTFKTLTDDCASRMEKMQSAAFFLAGAVLPGNGKMYKFGQANVKSVFSHGPFGGKTIGEVSRGLRSGEISPDELPIEYVTRNGDRVTLNNRSLAALRRAGVEPTKTIDRTGSKHHEQLLDSHLRGGQPSDHIRVRGGGAGASSIE
jgi:RHS repeat-associated protein